MGAVQENRSELEHGSAKRRDVPPLNSGDRLDREEFERRYAQRFDIKKAELIEGVVHVASPVRVEQHGRPHSRIITWLGVYEANTPGVSSADNTTLRLDPDNEAQPDAVLWIERGGNASITPDDYLTGAPELIVEVAASSATYDLHDKLQAYQRNGVQEYLVLAVREQQTVWQELQNGRYGPLAADGDGVLRSRIFPGLWLDSAAFWRGDPAGLLAVLQTGLESPVHKQFLACLKAQ